MNLTLCWIESEWAVYVKFSYYTSLLMLPIYKNSAHKALIIFNKLLFRLCILIKWIKTFYVFYIWLHLHNLLFHSHWKESKRVGGLLEVGWGGLLVFPGRKVWSSLFGSMVPGAAQCLAWWPCDCLQRNLMSSPAELCSKVSFHLSCNLWTLKLWAMELQLCQYTTN